MPILPKPDFISLLSCGASRLGRLRNLLLPCAALQLAGCTSTEWLTTPNAPYHALQNPAAGWEAKSSNATLRVVEFDDQGELWSHKQLDDTIKDIARVEKTSPDGVMLLVFVHGWHNSARPKWGGGTLPPFTKR